MPISHFICNLSACAHLGYFTLGLFRHMVRAQIRSRLTFPILAVCLRNAGSTSDSWLALQLDNDYSKDCSISDADATHLLKTVYSVTGSSQVDSFTPKALV